MDWWNRELVYPASEDDNEMDDDEDETAPLAFVSSRFRVKRIIGSSSTSGLPAKGNLFQGSSATRRTVERAATPIMSNASSKKNLKRLRGKKKSASTIEGSRGRRVLEDDGKSPDDVDIVDVENDDAAAVAEDDDEILPGSVQSPWIKHQLKSGGQTINTSRSMYAATPRAISPFRSQPYEYRRYHDALLEYLQARRNLSDLIDIDRKNEALASTTKETLAWTMAASGDPNLAREETTREAAFLRALKLLCWERDPASQQHKDGKSRREGNFWALMETLRQAGSAAMLWADDEASVRQHHQSKAAFLETKAAHIHATPKEMLNDLSGDEAPLVLKRRLHVLSWIENCLDQLVPAETNASVSLAYGDRDNSIFSWSTSAVLGRHLENALQACLALILAGRLKDARQLLREAGYPWIAAKIWGGAPDDLEKRVHKESVTGELGQGGNINRPLWKRQMWKLSEKTNCALSGSTADEAAIHSILANDFRNAMENSALRTWEKGLYVLLRAMWGRIEDELLHLQNNHRRKTRPPFPGTEYEQQEQEQLQATCELSNLTERGAVDMLAASPFESMKGREHFCVAAASLLIGRTCLTDFIMQETHCLTNNSNVDDEFDGTVRLRFVTHLLLYLDSLSASTTPVTLKGINECKNHALFAYVEHLAAHEDLWPFLFLYASLLPEEIIVDYVPTILARVEGREERAIMVQQARELLRGKGLDLKILKIVVRLILAEEDEGSSEEADSSTPTRLDIRKMKSIQWLCLYEDHMSDALIAANMLLRQFLIANKFASSVMFVQDFLPSAVVEEAMTLTVSLTEDEDTEDAISENELVQANLGKARTEFIAFRSFLKGVRAFDQWNLVITSTSFAKADIDDKVNISTLEESEQAIAKSMEQRVLIQQKRKQTKIVMEAAETAKRDLTSVLVHDGGWLADSTFGVTDTSEEELKRHQEIQALRSKLLPYTVKILHNVCEDTAAWVWSSLLDSAPELGSSPKEALEALNPADAGEDDKALAPFSPRYWTQVGLNLVDVVSSEEYLVLQAFDAAELKEMLARMSDIALSDLMYTA